MRVVKIQNFWNLQFFRPFFIICIAIWYFDSVGTYNKTVQMSVAGIEK